MKKYNLILCCLLSALIGCVGEESSQLAVVTPASGARVKFIHAVPDGPGVSILVNNRQFSGVLTTPPANPGVITYTGAFPINDYANVPLNDYANVAAGPTKVEVVIPASATAQQTTVISGTIPLETNKSYSIFAIGSVAAGGLEALVTVDNLVPADTSKAYIRFVNTVANATVGYDLGIGTTNFPTALANVKYKQATDFVAITPAAIGASATPIIVRANGATANLAPATLTLTPIKGRFYTYYVRGRVGGTGALAISASGYTNR